MGYTTRFSGHFTLTPKLTDEQRYILKGEGYCQWVPTKDGGGIEWDGNEKFYDYTTWINRINDTYLKPWGVALSGEVQWSGEDTADVGVLAVVDGVVVRRNGCPPDCVEPECTSSAALAKKARERAARARHNWPRDAYTVSLARWVETGEVAHPHDWAGTRELAAAFLAASQEDIAEARRQCAAELRKRVTVHGVSPQQAHKLASEWQCTNG